MVAFNIAAFAGAAPRKSKNLLEVNEAQKAINTKLTSGELASWMIPGEPSPSVVFSEQPLTIYGAYRADQSIDWFSWPVDVDVSRGPVADVNDYRIYYTGDGYPKKTNSVLALSGVGDLPRGFLAMGVSPPANKPTITVTGGTGTLETRIYVYTFISSFGEVEEESAPSPVSDIVNVPLSDSPTVQVSVSSELKVPGKVYNITKIRLYRSVTGTNQTAFLLVKEVPYSTQVITDDVLAANLGESIKSTTWDMPPDELSGLVLMPNGFFAGFVRNEVYFSEPFHPHAWPSDYSLAIDSEIVGLGVVGSTLVVTTDSNPYLISGINPAGMASERLPIIEPCVSKRSIASDDLGVMYASPNGVIRIGPGGAANVSKDILTKEDWRLYAPETMDGNILDGRYYLFYDDGIESGGVIFDRYNQEAPFSVTNIRAGSSFVSNTESILYITQGSVLKTWDTNNIFFLPFEWQSKMFTTPRPVNLGVIQAEGDFSFDNPPILIDELVRIVSERNRAKFQASGGRINSRFNDVPLNSVSINGSILEEIPVESTEEFIQVQVWANDILRHVAVILNNEPIRLPSGYKADRWEFIVSGNVPLRSIRAAETLKEMKRI